MPTLNSRLPDAERSIVWHYPDGVSQALARRIEGGSSPGEENLTFLLCELIDEGTTGLHLLEYSLEQAKEDLARAVQLEPDVKVKGHLVAYLKSGQWVAQLASVFGALVLAGGATAEPSHPRSRKRPVAHRHHVLARGMEAE